MTITKTADVDATLAQIYALAGAGADIVRCTCNEPEAAEGLARIVPRSPVPIVADIHFQHRLALAALDAGVHCLRLNPGNIRKPEQIKAVAEEAKARHVPIRIGLDLIACPSCGRAEIDVIKVARDAQAALDNRNLPIQVAVMGCVVNGPGEARGADIGIAAGRRRGHLFIKGQVVRVVPEDEMVEALVAEAERLAAEGIGARLAAADAGAGACAGAAHHASP